MDRTAQTKKTLGKNFLIRKFFLGKMEKIVRLLANNLKLALSML